MSFNICLDGGMILLTPTIEKMIFLSSVCAIFSCSVVQLLGHCVFHDGGRLVPIIHAVGEIVSR